MQEFFKQRKPAMKTVDASLGRLFAATIGVYRRFLSPLLRPACRFHPTCSVYAQQAMVRYGAVRGAFLSLRRLLRCHAFNPGGLDLLP